MNMEDPETDFLCGLLELQYGLPVQDSLKRCAQHVPWARGWPEDIKSFWNAEAFMWGHKIDTRIRKIIEDELQFLAGGTNLDIGCGAYSYIPSVGLDVSEKMLEFNERLTQRVVGNLEGFLPFADECFDSVTAILVLNYVWDYGKLFLEVRRVLRPKGIFMIVLYRGKINEWQRRQQVHDFSGKKWSLLLKEAEFTVKRYTKEGLMFLRGEKGIN